MAELTVIYALYVVLIVLGAVIHLALGKQPRTRARVIEVFLLCLDSVSRTGPAQTRCSAPPCLDARRNGLYDSTTCELAA